MASNSSRRGEVSEREAELASHALHNLATSLGNLRQELEQQLSFPADQDASPADRVASQRRLAELRSSTQRLLAAVLDQHPLAVLCVTSFREFRAWMEQTEKFLKMPYTFSWDDPGQVFEEIYGSVALIEEWTAQLQVAVPRSLRSVFLVHGHDTKAQKAVKYFLENKGFKVIVLGEQAGRGSPLIEKFHLHARQVVFAVVLLTGDDRGGPASADPRSYRLRARQNVIFELGFFRAALGPERVCVLYDDDVEIPSDYQGVEYVSMGEDWEHRLLLELRAAGLDER